MRMRWHDIKWYAGKRSCVYNSCVHFDANWFCQVCARCIHMSAEDTKTQKDIMNIFFLRLSRTAGALDQHFSLAFFQQAILHFDTNCWRANKAWSAKLLSTWISVRRALFVDTFFVSFTTMIFDVLNGWKVLSCKFWFCFRWKNVGRTVCVFLGVGCAK